MANDSVARSLAIAALSGGGGGEPSDYIKYAQVDGETLTLTNKDDSTVEFTYVDTTYTAGTNVSISQENVISATDTTYTAGTNVSISSDNVISATDTTYSAGTNVSIENGVISATDTTYSAGDNVTISNGVISAEDTTYTAGEGIDITNNVISATGGSSSVEVDNQAIVKDAWGRLTTNMNGGYFDHPHYSYICSSDLGEEYDPAEVSTIELHNRGDQPELSPSAYIQLLAEVKTQWNPNWHQQNLFGNFSEGEDNNWIYTDDWSFSVSIDKDTLEGTLTLMEQFEQQYGEIRNIQLRVQSQNMGRKDIPVQFIPVNKGFEYEYSGEDGKINLAYDKSQMQLIDYDPQQGTYGKISTLLGYAVGPSPTEFDTKWTWRDDIDAAEMNSGDRRIYIGDPCGFDESDLAEGNGIHLNFTFDIGAGQTVTTECDVTIDTHQGWFYGTVSNSTSTGDFSFMDGGRIGGSLNWQGPGTCMLELREGMENYPQSISVNTATLAAAKTVVLQTIDNDFIAEGAGLPSLPENDGTYTLQVTITDGEPTFSWVSE